MILPGHHNKVKNTILNAFDYFNNQIDSSFVIIILLR
jgi:hypothetical protein